MVGPRRRASLLLSLAAACALFLAFAATALATPHTYEESLPAPTGGFHEPWGVAVGTSGELFVSNHAAANVIDVYEGGAFVKEFEVGISGDILLQLAVDHSTEAGDPNKGDLYVADASTDEVLRFTYDPETETLTPAGSIPTSTSPLAVTVDSKGDVFVAVYEEDQFEDQGFEVNKYDSAGTVITESFIPLTLSAPLQPNLAIDAGGHLDVAGEEVFQYDVETGACLNSCTKLIPPRLISGIAIGPEPDGDIYVIQSAGGTLPPSPEREEVEVFEPNGTFVEQFDPTHLIGNGHGLAVTGTAGDTTVYETDSTGNEVAVFTQGPPPTEFPLNLSTSGTGSGSFECKVLPSGTAGPCAAEYEEGKEVEVIANAALGSEFVEWQGLPCDESTLSTCTVTMNAEQSLTGVFNVEPGTGSLLTVFVTGQGEVNSSPAGITGCKASAGTCTGQFEGVVTLTETPTSGNVFAGWVGCKHATGTTCEVTVNEAKEVYAVFLTEGTAGAPGPNGETPTITVTPFSGAIHGCGLAGGYDVHVVLGASSTDTFVCNGTNGTNGAAGSQGAPGTNGTNGKDGSNGATGPAGAAGPQGPAGAPGRDAKVTCKVKGKKVTCKVKLVASASSSAVHWRLMRAGRTYRHGRATGRHLNLNLSNLRPGRYVLHFQGQRKNTVIVIG
jgi:hypothetical protein